MRRIWSAHVVTAAMLGVLVLTGCARQGGSGGGAPADEPAAPPTTSTPAEPDMTGTVTKTKENAILVEEQPGVPNGGRKAWVSLADADTAAEAPQLVGKRVDVWLTGPCAESYPEQCTGATVKLA